MEYFLNSCFLSYQIILISFALKSTLPNAKIPCTTWLSFRWHLFAWCTFFHLSIFHLYYSVFVVSYKTAYTLTFSFYSIQGSVSFNRKFNIFTFIMVIAIFTHFYQLPWVFYWTHCFHGAFYPCFLVS